MRDISLPDTSHDLKYGKGFYVRISPTLIREFKAWCAKRGITMSQKIEDIILAVLEMDEIEPSASRAVKTKMRSRKKYNKVRDKYFSLLDRYKVLREQRELEEKEGVRRKLKENCEYFENLYKERRQERIKADKAMNNSKQDGTGERKTDDEIQ